MNKEKTCTSCKFYRKYKEKTKNTNWDGFCCNREKEFDPVLKNPAESIFPFKLFLKEIISCEGYIELKKEKE